MAFSKTWTAAYEAEPAASDNAGLGDDEFRVLKLATRERQAVDHEWSNSQEDGKHKKLTFTKQSAAGTLVTDEIGIWAEDDDEGNSQLHIKHQAGGEFIAAMYDPTTSLEGLISQFEDTIHFKAVALTGTPVALDAAAFRHYSYFSLTTDGISDRNANLMTTGVVQGRQIMLVNDDATERVRIVSENASTVLGWLLPGQWVVLQATAATPTDSTGWRVINYSRDVTAFTADGSFYPLPFVLNYHVMATGGGGGGGGADAFSTGICASGGGGAGQVIRKDVSVTQGTEITVTVGDGGAGGVSGNNNGAAGTNTTFGSYLTGLKGTGGERTQSGNKNGDGGMTLGAPLAGGAGGGGTGKYSETRSGVGGFGIVAGGAARTSTNHGIAASANSGAGGGGAYSSAGTKNGGAGGTGRCDVRPA